MKLSRRFIIIGLLPLMIFSALIITTNGQATAPPLDSDLPQEEISALLAAAQPKLAEEDLPALEIPTPEQSPCLHCHIAGSIETDWMPISRWLVFGAMGFAFIFGTSRNLIVWRKRNLWHHDWMQQFSRITALLFILQAVAGILLLIFSNTTSETIVSLTTIIKTIHWGSGIALFFATLGLCFAGYQLAWFQRAFWAGIFIMTLIGGTLAVANLSFAHLYSEWHTPPTPSQLYGFHMLLLPVAIAGMISIYFMILRKRGEAEND